MISIRRRVAELYLNHILSRLWKVLGYEPFCRCGGRKGFIMHEWSRRAFHHKKLWFGDIPPHRFVQEESLERVREFQAAEDRSLMEWRI